ncbi:MAG: ABC transporter ATP-binding protein [Actinobacteria bacterium]|nr:ABC transporter ATP-binding protein [Actinomycetota bacterium]
MSALLRVEDLHVDRGGFPVVRGVGLEVCEGSIAVLLGNNGAGKSTTLDGIAGAIPVAGGRVTLSGLEITQSRPYQRARLGLAYVEQGKAVFPALTAEENVMVAAPRGRALEALAMFPELHDRRRTPAGLLSGGEQQMLVVARALSLQPRVLLLDEISFGLAPVIVLRLMAAVRRLADDGMAVLLVEQFASLALEVGDRAYVLNKGTIEYEGPCRTLIEHPEILHTAYLGISPVALSADAGFDADSGRVGSRSTGGA